MMPGSGNKQEDDTIVFAKEDEQPESDSPLERANTPWKILVVDDEDDVHKITRLTLRGYEFEGRPVELISAYSGTEAMSVVKQETDIALVLLDVVMEEDDSGLEVVEYIRKAQSDKLMRIVLRTGQPGKAPEHDVIVRYDINDYKTKPEFTAQKLFTCVTTCLRAYKNLKNIHENAQGLEAILRSSAMVFKNQSMDNLGANILDYLIDVFHQGHSDRVDSAYLMGLPGSTMQVIAGTGIYKGRISHSVGDALPEKVLEMVSNCSRSGGDYFQDDEYVSVFKTKEGFSCVLYFNRCHRLSEVQKKLVRVYANNIAIGLDNVSLAREIINTQKEVILTLGEIVETRSQETAYHVTRVAELSYMIATEYGLDPDACDLLRLAAPMHDVGKIGVPETILNKPGKLNSEEFKAVQKHSGIGYAILKKSNRSIMQAAAIIALHHHERWDGKGYPKGLSGNDIHIFGRIVAVADVFDALSHERCYKKAWPMERIIDLFQSESGKHFDPDLANIFLKNTEAFQAINNRFPA